MEAVQQLETAGPQGAGFLHHQMGTLRREISAGSGKRNFSTAPRCCNGVKSRPNCGEALVTQGCVRDGSGVRTCVGVRDCRALGVEEVVSLISPDWLDARGELTPTDSAPTFLCPGKAHSLLLRLLEMPSSSALLTSLIQEMSLALPDIFHPTLSPMATANPTVTS